jgi:hypothetical protein
VPGLQPLPVFYVENGTQIRGELGLGTRGAEGGVEG